MKNYRNAAPILLIGFVLLAMYSRITELQKQEVQYYQYVDEARSYREGKIYTDALEQYQKALNMNQTIALCEEIGEMLLEEGKSSKIRSWGEFMITTYPKEITGYEYMIDYEVAQGKYDDCFDLYDTVQKRGLYSEQIEEDINSIRYAYSLSYTSFVSVEEYSNTYSVYSKEDGLYGYCNASGKEMLKSQYMQAGAFGKEYAAIQDANSEFYYINAQGDRKLNIPQDIKVTKLGYLIGGIYAVGTEGEMYYADENSNIVLGPYEDALTFNNGITAIKENELWYMINLQGNKLSEGYLSFACDNKEMIYRNDTIFAQTQEGYVALNAEGKEVNQEKYEDVKCFLDNTYTAVKKNGLWGFIDKNGKMIIEPQYEDAKPFLNGLAAIKKDGMWGYIDQNGTIAIEPEFEEANCMNDKGITFVKTQNGKWSKLTIIGGV